MDKVIVYPVGAEVGIKLPGEKLKVVTAYIRNITIFDKGQIMYSVIYWNNGARTIADVEDFEIIDKDTIKKQIVGFRG